MEPVSRPEGAVSRLPAKRLRRVGLTASLPDSRTTARRRLDGDRVEFLAGVLGDGNPDPQGHGHHKDRYGQESESEGPRSLLQRDGSERPQHKSDKEADEPDDAVGDAANTGRKHLGGQGRAWAPEAEEPEAPGEAEDPEPKVASRIDPERHEDGTPEQ